MMTQTEREKIIKGLECCAISLCDDCPYDDKSPCSDFLHMDALALLKEEEHERVTKCKDCCYGKIQQTDSDGRIWISCGKAGHLIDGDWFCAEGKRGKRV